MAGVLVLSVNLQQRADMLSTLRARDADLGFQEASLRARVDEASSVTLLSQRAYRLGMRPDPAPAFINLTTGADRRQAHRGERPGAAGPGSRSDHP